MISAEIILDSISPQGIRLTTFRLRYPKIFVHQELLTHRVFSRNSSSGRAVPTKIYIEETTSNELRAEPVEWGLNQRGMQASGVLDGDLEKAARAIWAEAAHDAARHAQRLADLGLHKQVCNALLTPFNHYNVLVTSTEYMNFFGLRLHKDARPEIRVLAEKMFACYQESQPKLLQPGQWHLPLVTQAELDEYGDDDIRFKISIARCARVSYSSFKEGKLSTVDEDVARYLKLVGAQPIHASPAEHQATPDEWLEGHWRVPAFHGNFTGWIQFRKTLPGERIAPLPEDL
jgi:thymidylate synthase ThyX